MLSKPLYEVLPLSYVAIGSLGILLFDQAFAQFLAVIVYLWGSRIYSLRSNNRRTDAKKTAQERLDTKPAHMSIFRHSVFLAPYC